MPPFVLGMGNPIMDISCKVDKAFIEKYKVPLGAACLAEAFQQPMYKELCEMKDTEYIAGGATLNSIRVAKWVLGSRGKAGYMGAIGDDKFGKMMTDQCKQNGVEPGFMVNKEVATGTCAVGIVDKERGLVANLAAANTYKKDHLDSHPEMLNKASIIYSAGYFLTVSADSMLHAAETAQKLGSVYAIGLAAPFIIEVPPFREGLLKVIALADFVFGNETEAQTFAKCVCGKEDMSVADVARHIANMPTKNGRVRTAILTQGAGKTIVARTTGFYMEVPVEPLPKEKIVDLNAAGDAFTGGFLAGLALGKSCEECVTMGHQTAGYIIQRSGCTMEGGVASRLEG